MKNIYTGDWHYGDGTAYGTICQKTGLNTAVIDTVNSVNQLIEYCKNNTVDNFWITGDIYREGNGSADTKRRELFSRQLREIARNVKHLHIVVGNHDIYGDTNIYSEIIIEGLGLEVNSVPFATLIGDKNVD